MVTMVICSVCGEEKPHAAKGMCSLCYGRQNRAKNHDRRIEQQRQSRADHPERTKMYNDASKERRDQYYQTNREDIRAQQYVYRNAHLDEERERGKAYREANHDTLKLDAAKYRSEHPRIHFLGKDVQMTRHPHPPPGYDYHHMFYDHSDPENGIVLLSKSSHAMGHHLLRKLNIVIPHINIEGE